MQKPTYRLIPRKDGHAFEIEMTARRYYGPTMNAFEAADKAGRADDLRKELEALFESENTSQRKEITSIPATFLRVTVTVN